MLDEVLGLDLQRTGQAPAGCGMYPLALAGLEGRDRRPADVGELRKLHLGEASPAAMLL